MTTPKKTRTARGPRRPKMYRARAAERVCALICQGYTLREIAARGGMPTLATLHRWYAENETFRAYYTSVRRFQRDVIADDMMAIADAFNTIDRADRKLSMEARGVRIEQINDAHPEATAVANDAHETLERLQRALERVRKREMAAVATAAESSLSGESVVGGDSPEGDGR